MSSGARRVRGMIPLCRDFRNGSGQTVWGASLATCCPLPAPYTPRARADVRWNVTSVSEVPARFEQAFQEQVLDEVATPAVLLAPVNETVFPTDSLFQNSSGVFNVVFVKDLGAWGWSVYNHRASALLHAESPSEGAPGFSESTRLAQGLGRMLSLGYTGCYQHPSSLMSTDCDGVDNANLKGLDSCQLSAAMAQAEANAPWSRGGNAACPCGGCGYNYSTVMALGISTVAAVFLVGLVVISYTCHARRKRGRMVDMDDNEEDEDGGFGMGSSRFFASQRSMRDVGSVDDLRDGEAKKDK